MALGGVSKKPDLQTDAWLKSRSLILLSLDIDEPGKNNLLFWSNNYSNLRHWPSPNSKSPGDAFSFNPEQISKWIKFVLFL